MELLALESEKGDSNFYDPIQNFDFINLNFYLTKSFNEYMYHITDSASDVICNIQRYKYVYIYIYK